MATEKDHGGSTVSGDVSAAGVDNMGEVDLREELFDQFFAELPFHKAVGGDLSGEAALCSQLKDAFQKGDGQRILPMAGFKAFAVALVELPVFGGDVGRIGDDGVVDAGAERLFEGGEVFALVGVFAFGVVAGEFEVEDLLSAAERAVEQ